MFRKFVPMNDKQLVIAIDGPSGSGKSTTAKLVAARLGYTYIDTGAMYRAVTLAALRQQADLTNQTYIEELSTSLSIDFIRNDDGSLKTLLQGQDVSTDIRRPEITANVSLVSSYAGVRQAMVALQRQMSSKGGVVLDGRDIGTVVFPNADLKIFMVAGIDARAQRRQQELAVLGEEVSVEDVAMDLERRDSLDSGRDVSPLRKAEDAVEIDTSGLSIEGQVEKVIALVAQIQDSKSNVQQ